MRYRITEQGMVPADGGSSDVVFATVCFTLVVGIIFLVAGVRGEQRWLRFWGALTCACCAAYFLRDWIGFERLL